MSYNIPIPRFPAGEPAFVEDLRTGINVHLDWDFSLRATKGKLDLRRGVSFYPEFDDPEKLLDTASEELLELLRNAGINLNGNIPLRTLFVDELEKEEFHLDVSDKEIRLESGDIEGIRRAIYFLEEKLTASPGPFLQIGSIIRKPWLKNRISRCFFGPIKRPPFNIDELMNDIDYYPDKYLARLAREGVNGLWLTIVFREICQTSFLPENPHAEKRLGKLRQTVEKCRRYGIKIWVFCIEPINWNRQNPCPTEHPEWLGPELPPITPVNSFCPRSESAARYLYESAKSIFTNVPHLGGMITISLGECITSCLSMMNTITDDRKNPCPGKCNLETSDILVKTLNPLAKGIHDANPDAELISWLYIPQPQQTSEWIYKLPEKLNKNVILAFNFESGVNKLQLGKIRCGGDYWLSTVGPSDRFGRIATVAKKRCAMAAKLQVCCSHEIATVPFIPVPGLLYRKYKAMKEVGVEHVIQCWYFGNFPGLMNRAAGKLAFEDFDSLSENEFLSELALVSWRENADDIVKVWVHFANAYCNYPLDNMFQYYGPMHDGPVWPLHLKQVMLPLPRTWKPDTEPAGDSIGECMQNHTLAENVILTRRLSNEWHDGFKLFKKILPAHLNSKECRDDALLYEALDLLFKSCANILEFYQVRNSLLDLPVNSSNLLDPLERLVRAETANSRRLAELCELDTRLGYHSEAEVYKFYPEKLRWRADFLEHMLANEFRELHTLLTSGYEVKNMLCKYIQNIHFANIWYNSSTMRWKFTVENGCLKFCIECQKDGNIYDESLSLYFFDKKGEKTPWMLLCAERWRRDYPKTNVFDYFSVAQFEISDTDEAWIIDVIIPESMLEDTFWFGLRRSRDTETLHLLEYYPDIKDDRDGRLGLFYFRPDCLVAIQK